MITKFTGINKSKYLIISVHCPAPVPSLCLIPLCHIYIYPSPTTTKPLHRLGNHQTELVNVPQFVDLLHYISFPFIFCIMCKFIASGASIPPLVCFFLRNCDHKHVENILLLHFQTFNFFHSMGGSFSCISMKISSKFTKYTPYIFSFLLFLFIFGKFLRNHAQINFAVSVK